MALKRQIDSGSIDLGPTTYLILHQHGHVHEHVVQFTDRVLQLHDVGVTGFDIGQSLSSLLRFHNNLKQTKRTPISNDPTPPDIKSTG